MCLTAHVVLFMEAEGSNVNAGLVNMSDAVTNEPVVLKPNALTALSERSCWTDSSYKNVNYTKEQLV